MSAWIVSRAHINILVSGLVQRGLIHAADATRTGRILWDENYRSVNARYGERNVAPSFTARLAAKHIPWQHLLFAVHCYDYQSCETDDYPQTLAHDWVKALVDSIEDEVPDASAQLSTLPRAYGVGVAGLHWGYERVTDAYSRL